jgi:hypothetical protein
MRSAWKDFSRRRFGLGAVLLVLAAAGVAPAARADIIAALEVPSPSGRDLDLALVNAATGQRLALPAGVNTPADEFHPSVSSNGGRIAFQRVDSRLGTNRIIVVEQGVSNEQADLFDVFSAQRDLPSTPFLAAADSVLTGRPLQAVPGSSRFQPVLGRTKLNNFPNGPFTNTVEAVPLVEAGAGFAENPVQAGPRLAFDLQRGRTQIALSEASRIVGGVEVGHGRSFEEPGGLQDSHPTFGNGVIVFQRDSGVFTASQLGFRPSVDPDTFASTRTELLPRIVNLVGVSATHPAFTADRRFLGFLRSSPSDRHSRLMVFDTQSQTLLNSSGIDLGELGAAGDLREGNLALYQPTLLRPIALTPSGALTVRLSSSTGVGILVQRIVGHHMLLGRRVPTLRMVGRVPFGLKRKGKVRIHWNHRVSGHKLRPGRYLVTVRAVTASGTVRELSRSFAVRIRS